VLVFQKKKSSLSEQCAEQCAVEPCSTVEVPFPPREVAKCCFSKLAVQSLILMGPTSKMHFIFLNQTLSCVAAGEPHPQPHSQTATLPNDHLMQTAGATTNLSSSYEAHITRITSAIRRGFTTAVTNNMKRRTWLHNTLRDHLTK